jgi:hypothetical protein
VVVDASAVLLLWRWQGTVRKYRPTPSPAHAPAS